MAGIGRFEERVGVREGSPKGVPIRLKSYAKLKTIVFIRGLARPEGFEPPTLCSGGTRSIHLSYGRAGCTPRNFPDNLRSGDCRS